jgi:hypothetical protein
MAAPTFGAITPAVGHTGGQYVCKVTGSDFKLPPAPPATGYVGGSWTPSMEIEVNGRPATDIRVYTTGLLTFIMPAFRGAPGDIGTGVDVDLVLRNLDPVEETTEVDGFQYKRTNIARGDSILAHVVRTMINDIRRQIVDNVAVSTAIEYDADTGAAIRKVEIAGTPAIGLFGPALRENVIYRQPRRPPVQNVGALTFDRYREAFVADILFDFTIFTKGDGARRDLLNLQNLAILFFRNKYSLTVDVDSSDPAAGTEELQLWLTVPPSVDSSANASGLLSATGSFEIRAVPLDHDDWLAIERGYMLDDPPDLNITAEQMP